MLANGRLDLTWGLMGLIVIAIASCNTLMCFVLVYCNVLKLVLIAATDVWGDISTENFILIKRHKSCIRCIVYFDV